MHIQNSVLLLAAMGATNAAGRATHRHRHADLHKERSVGDIVHAVINGVEVSWTNTYDGSNEGSGDAAATVSSSTPETTESPAPAAANVEVASAASTEAASTTTSAKAAASSSSSSSGSAGADVVTSYTPFCKANNKRATAAQIAYVGNVGSEWGCNQLLVAEDVADQYDYTIKITGKNTEPWKVVCTNKIGPDGKIDGWYNGNAAVEFTLQPGATQYVAVDANTQGICAAAPGDSIPVDAQGGYASTWFEFDFANESNNGWSGADISSIQAEAAGLTVQGMQTCHSDICSSIFELTDGQLNIDNAFDFAKKLADGLGLNIPSGKTQIDLILGYDG